MRTFFLLGSAFVFFTSACAEPAQTIGTIEARDPAFAEQVPAEAKIEVLADGFAWTEGPVWVADDSGGHLLFSDIPSNSIYRWSESRGVELFMRPSGYTGVDDYGGEPGSNGLALDPQGLLLCCEHGDRRISKLTRGGGKLTLVDRYEGKRLNSPNDLAVDRSGTLYFTDPPYGLPKQAADPRRELDFCGVYRLDVDGTLTLLTKQFNRPNGIGLSPDETTLYVAQSDPESPIWMAFPLKPDLSLGEGRLLLSAAEFMNDSPGLPDGLCIRSDGTIFASGPGGVYVIAPEGKLLGRIMTGGRVSNCEFNDDQSVLYLTADDRLCRVKVK